MGDDMLLDKVLNLDAIKQMKASVHYSIKYGAMVGAATILSGLLGGRTGLLVGGVASSCLAGLVASGEFESVPYILKNKTTREEKQKILKEIRNFILSHGESIREFIYSEDISKDLENGIIAIVMSLLAEKGLQVQKQAISL